MLLKRFSSHLLGSALLLPLALSGCGTGGSSVFNCSSSRFVPNYSDAVRLLHWRRFPLKVAFTNDVAYEQTSLRAVALTGFDEWVQGTGEVTTYTLVNEAASADITVTFQDVGGLPNSGGELGSTDQNYNVSTLNLNHATTILNYRQGMSADQVYKGLKATAAHEYGHALGIVGHSPNPEDIMYAGVADNVDKPLTQRDLNTIKTDYCSRF